MSTLIRKTRAEQGRPFEANEALELRFPRKAELGTVIDDLVLGLPVSDFRFDAIFPASLRRLSGTHWTPVDVARRAADLIDMGQETRVLDIGSGVGKFCMVAALTSKGTYTGVEQRPHLAQLAHKLSKHYEIPGV